MALLFEKKHIAQYWQSEPVSVSTLRSRLSRRCTLPERENKIMESYNRHIYKTDAVCD